MESSHHHNPFHRLLLFLTVAAEDPFGQELHDDGKGPEGAAANYAAERAEDHGAADRLDVLPGNEMLE